MKSLFILSVFLFCVMVGTLAQTSTGNYIISRIMLNDTESLYMDKVVYYDGLGRPYETVQKGFTPLGSDLVTYQEYDVVGRESKKWLPATVPGNNGLFVPLNRLSNYAANSYLDSKPYNLPIYEASPLNRVLEQYGPGQAWQNNSRSVKTVYLTNIAGNDTLNCIYYEVTNMSNFADTVMTVTNKGNYETAQIYVFRTTDEDGNTSFEFKNKLGQVVLTRQIVPSGSTKITHDTYYIYDDFGNLTAVLPPIASDNMKSGTSWTNVNSAILRDYAYLYMYDGRSRCKAKRLPGCSWNYYVYDTGDRLIFSQDGEQRKKGEWSFTLPDVFGRTCVSGICKNSFSALSTTSPLNNVVVKAERDNTIGIYKGYALSGVTLIIPTVLNVNYYDDYAFMGKNGIPDSIDTNFRYEPILGFGIRHEESAKTFLTGTLTAKLDGSVTPTYLYSVMYYDYRGRVIQTKSNNHLVDGIEKEYVAYNFTGQPIQKKHVHSATGKDTQTELYTYAYDHVGRLLTAKHRLTTGSKVGTEFTLIENTYDELGRLKTSRKNEQANLTTTYAYNIRSWLKSSSSPLFSQTLYYNDAYVNSTPRYNGNISAMSWSTFGENKTRGYTFVYDNLSRLTAAGYLENGTLNGNFATSYAYDKHGNMTFLSRRGNTGTSTYGLIDNLSLTYVGNQLLKVEDTGTNVTLSQSMDFKNYSNAAREYYYDKNGNLTQDLNKGVTEITYNLLNLPQTLSLSNSFGSANNTYVYAADGRKLKTSIGSKTTDYCGNVIYENGMLKRILLEGGYIENGSYNFYLTDHLGNNRVVVNAGGSVMQTNHYYPFGMSFAEGTTTSLQPYKYNGKELDMERGLNWYDFDARMYDGMRFTTRDPLQEKYPWISPYTYCNNNPMRYIDPTGMDWYQDDNGNAMWRRSQDKEYTDNDGKKWKNIGENYLFTNGKTATLFQQHKNDKGELVLRTSAYNLEDETGKDNLLSDVGSILSTSSTLSGSVGDISQKSNATFRLINSKGVLDLKFYGNGWGGNQWVKTAKINELGAGLKMIGWLTGGFSMAISLDQFKQATTVEGKIEHGLDAFMGGAGFLPGFGVGASLYWTFGGKHLHYMYVNKVLIPQIKMGLNPGLAAYQPFK